MTGSGCEIMTIYLLFQAFFDGDTHPKPQLLSAHQSLSGARGAAMVHLERHPKVCRYAYSRSDSENGSVVVETTLENVGDDESADYFIVPLEMQP